MSRSYRVLRWAVRLLLRGFFHRIEVSGLENIPPSGGGIVVAWHPNALVDPALIFVSFPRPIAFGARHGIFQWPIIGRIVRAIGTVPIFRAEDLDDPRAEESRQRANRMSIDAMANAVARGKFTALFPEGLSHDDPAPRSLKTGVARIFYRAFEQTRPVPPVLLPVGLHYERKGILGSRVLIVYHRPLDLDPDLVAATPARVSAEEERLRCKKLTQELEGCLRNIVHATENWRIHDLLHRARRLVRAERAARSGRPATSPSMAEEVLGFRRLWTGYNLLRDTHPREVQTLYERITRYDAALTALGLDDHELDAATARLRGWIRWRLAVRAILVLVLLPLALLGYIVNLPPAGIVWWVNKRRSRHEKDQATVKLLTGAVAFPVAWLGAAVAVSVLVLDATAGTPAFLSIGIPAFLLAALSGLLVMNYQRFAVETLGGLRHRYRRTGHDRTIHELRAERRSICREVEALSRDLDLPGTVLPDGTVLRDATLLDPDAPGSSG